MLQGDGQRQGGLRVRIVDYEGNEGGGRRFVVETLRALHALCHPKDLEFVSAGSALRFYRVALSAACPAIRFAALEPQEFWKRHLIDILRLPGISVIRSAVPSGAMWHVSVPKCALSGDEVVWFPWLHRHRLPLGPARNVIGTFHDDTFLTFGRAAAGHPHSFFVADEEETVNRWLRSEARFVVTSNATAASVGARFGVSADRFTVIPIVSRHARDWTPQTERPEAEWADGRYLLCPANISLHKNHEVLLQGFARWGAKWPLVLTGSGTESIAPQGATLWPRPGRVKRLLRPRRAVRLRHMAEALQLSPGDNLIGLGFVPEEAYRSILTHAAALVMPTLAEGGGSFPVGEAIHLGIPVVCSDIPVLREQVSRANGKVLFFDPRDPEALSAQLGAVERDYEAVRHAAQLQVSRLSTRSWHDVASEYWDLMVAVSSRVGGDVL